MSTIVCIKDADRIVIGTDSRTMTHDFSAIDSDSREKLIELAPGLFFAESGWVPLGDVLIGLARTIAREHVTDIRLLAAALTEAAGPFLREFAGVLSQLRNPHQKVIETMTGVHPLQGFLLAGRSAGKLGYVYYEYYVRNGSIVLKPREYFGEARQIEVTNGLPIAHLSQDPATWTDSPVRVVQRFLSAQRQANPHIGGPDQIVTIDCKGARWVSRLPAAKGPGAILAHATIAASITMTAPTLVIASGSVTVNIDSTNRVLVTDTSQQARAKHDGFQFRIEDTLIGSNFSQVTKGHVFFATATTSSELTDTSLRFNGQQVVGPRQAVVSAPVGGATVDNEARAAINAIINRCNNHGLF